MTTSRIYKKDALTSAEVAAHAGSLSEVGQSLAGRDRHLWEMAHGASAVTGEPAAVGLNPQGLVGVDMSGPPFGPCLLLPVAWWQGRSGGGVQPTNAWSAIDGTAVVFPWRVWNRPHAFNSDGTSPLSQLGLFWRGTASAGTSSVFRCTVENRSNGTTTAIDTTINTTTTTQYPATTLIPFVPEANDLVVTWQRLSGTRTLEIHSLMLALVVKRRHGLSFPG
jgi:hypothetical protein